MAFTAGSPELAKATKLASKLSSLYQTFGASNMNGITAIGIIESHAKKLGFGITGLTTGSGFPPFGSVLPSSLTNTTVALQNPRGETAANNITLGLNQGYTVGIYLPKFVRGGEDYAVKTYVGATLAAATNNTTGNTLSIRGPFIANTNDKIYIDSAVFTVTGGRTAAATGFTAEVTVSPSIGKVYAVGTLLDIGTIGVTRGTVGIAGSTFERFTNQNQVNGGFTAAVYFGVVGATLGTVS